MTKHRHMKTYRGPEGEDLRVAERIRIARNHAGVSQEKIGRALGISFQQVQKYESGKNRITVGKLSRWSIAVGVPLTVLLDGLGYLPQRKQAKPGGLEYDDTQANKRSPETWEGFIDGTR